MGPHRARHPGALPHARLARILQWSRRGVGTLALARVSQARWEQLAIIAIIVGALMRAAWVLALHPPLDYVYSDMGGYVDRAVKLASGGALGRYDAFYPPGAHWMLALPLVIFGTDRTGLWAGAILWWALSATTPLAMWRFARYHLTLPAAALTAIFVSLSPLHIVYAGYFTSETPALAMLVLSLWLAARASALQRVRSAFVSGLLGGLAVASRPALLANLVVEAVVLRHDMRVRIGGAIVAGAAAVLALVIAHNTVAAGELTLTSENSGLTFWLGQCQVRSVKAGTPATGTFEFIPPPAIERASGKDVVTDHVAWDQSYFYAQAFQCIRDDGVGHLRVLARGILDMTLTSTPWPPLDERDLGPRVAFLNAMYSIALPFILGGAVWLIRERRRRGERPGEMVMLTHFACLLLTAILFFGDPRYRIPYDVFVFALAAALVARVAIERPGAQTETVRSFAE